ncbi:class I SAM-dependent rRNA methyltransferase [Herpetosiphon giganteus]|uniref:class I SAM-dependent rRNA methyltransferase n=1 Tax=Herpetosiphon giganteus TaxID=2029754 RepID=UPI0019587785|nr:class I SAM-dependent methyltransferase [Herpetosiphon giganteus]MBM7846624.1 23S rRNA (cytosine1962-C5)-methyltransferase [Herpetosiphon giganteus]
MLRFILKPDRDKSIRQRHPWVFSGAVARRSGPVHPGETVDIVSSEGVWLARGTASTHSQMIARLWTWQRDEELDPSFIRQRIERAIKGREQLHNDPQTNAYRVIFSESDGLPGLIVDRFADWLVVQLLTQGAVAHTAIIVEALAELMPVRGIYERSDVEIRAREGLGEAEGLLWGEAPPDQLTIRENGYEFVLDLAGGQKTGWYVDQRVNRMRVAQYAKNADVLGVFSYTGGFEVLAAGAGATSITAVDSSAAALRGLHTNLAQNGLHTSVTAVEGDAFKILRQLREEGKQYDLIVLDPPKFAHSQSQIDRATRGYKDINMQAFHLLRPGGVLATFSCSGLISADLFQKVVFGAALDAGRDAQIIETLTQGGDHPVLLTFPEAAYLKGLICRVW